MTGPEPIATGALETTSFAELLVSVSRRSLSGTLVVAETPERRHAVLFQAGCPMKAQLAEPHALLAAVMEQMGIITQGQVAQILDLANQEGMLTGQAAVQLGMATDEAVRMALGNQVARRTARLFAVTTGTYGFYQQDLLAGVGGSDNPPIDPLPIVLMGIRDCYDPIRLSRALAPLAGQHLTFKGNPATLNRFGFSQDEGSVVTALKRPQTLEALRSFGRAPVDAVQAVVHCLQVTDLLEVDNVGEGGAQPAPGGSPGQPTTPPPAQAAPAEPTPAPAPAPAPPKKEPSEPKSDKRIAVEAFLEKAKDMDYFQILGIGRDGNDGEIQRGYIARAKKFHPDRATGDLADLKVEMADVFARISVAQQTLKDPETRKKYVATLDNEGGEEGGETSDEDETVRKILDAETAFQKGKIFLRMNQIDDAEKLARQAVDANPDHGDYKALLTWICSKRRKKGEDLSDLIERLREAVQAAPNSEDAQYYMAQLLYRAGRRREALTHYEKVMAINTHNIDAVRMVRFLRRKAKSGKLSDTTESSKKDKKELGGILGVLFKDIGGKK